MSGFDLLVLGDVNPDLILHGDTVVPAFGQAERLVDEARLVIGGSGAILACGAAKLGLRVALAGVVGDDMFGRYMCERLQAHGVDTSAVVVLPDRPTGVTVVLSGRHDRAMLTSPGTIGELRRSVIDEDLLRRTRHVHVSSYFLQRELAPELPGLFHDARAGDTTTSLDPNWDPTGVWDSGLTALLPEIDVFLGNGYTKEEWKVVTESRKILGLPDLRISCTAVRIPVHVSHSEAVHAETRDPITPDRARELFAAVPGVVVQDDPAAHEYPLASEAAGRDEIFVGRVRTDPSIPDGRGIAFWVVSDNLRKGAATNAVEIAEVLVDRDWVGHATSRGAQRYRGPVPEEPAGGGTA